MKIFKNKFLLGLIIGVLFSSAVGVYAAISIMASDIGYSNSKTSATNVKDALNELYDKVPTGGYTDSILHGADPVLPNDLIPVTISNDGTVTYANVNEKWYSYEDKNWANAVNLVSSPSNTYSVGSTISSSDIDGYFVWIPRYKYELWNVGTTDVSSNTVPRTISVVFESSSTSKSSGTKNGTYLTHPAFTFGSKELNGFWIGKFEMTGSSSKVTVLPNVKGYTQTSYVNNFTLAYNYNRNDDSHEIKNMEWGAVAYLTASSFGKNSEVYSSGSITTGCGNNSATGGSTSTCINGFGTSSSYPQSTTGNISGVFDMAGCNWEYVSAYVSGNYSLLGFGADPSSLYNSKYFNIYSASSTSNTSYSYRYLGDATGEMGSFTSNISSWYGDYGSIIFTGGPIYIRGGASGAISSDGLFGFLSLSGLNSSTTRIVLVS
ncbi:MAG TPA: hypothetical protein PLC25_02290 [Bacilli bacterium]|nr:hypothetical protein [Bacilli bacterium]